MPTKKESFTRDIPGISNPYTAAPATPVDPSKAAVVEQFGKMWIEGRRGYEEARLEGFNNPLQGEVGETVKDTTSPRLTEEEAIKSVPTDELNLNRVANMRRQGVISADAAKVLAAKAVAAASARLPGRGAEFRQQAAAYFGDLGPGQDLLQQTAAEKEAGKKNQVLENEMTRAGWYELDANGNQFFPPQLKKHFSLIQRQEFQNKVTRGQYETDFLQGKYAAADLQDYGASLSGSLLNETLGKHIALSKNGTIDGEALTAEIQVALSGLQNSLYTRLEEVRKKNPSIVVDPSVMTTIVKNAKESMEPILAFAKTKDWVNVGERLVKGEMNFLKHNMIQLLPEIAGMEAIAPGMGVKYIDIMEKMSTMTTAQMKHFLQVSPGSALVLSKQDGLNLLRNQLHNIGQGKIPQLTDPAVRSAYRLAATTILSDPNVKNSPELQDKAANAANALLKAGDQDVEIALKNPTIKANLTPVQIEAIAKSIAVKASKAMQELTGAYSFEFSQNPNIGFNERTNRFELKGFDIPQEFGEDNEYWQEHSARGHLQAAVDELNRAYTLGNTYDDAKGIQQFTKGMGMREWIIEKIGQAKEGGMEYRKSRREAAKAAEEAAKAKPKTGSDEVDENE